jgi:hypothetical protein
MSPLYSLGDFDNDYARPIGADDVLAVITRFAAQACG